jgi:glutamate synthase (NADPH/NADH) large chain
VAYVLDDERLLAGRISKATVDLESLEADDEQLLRALVEEHVGHTRSARGKSLLASWGKRRFVKVMPHEWRRILKLRKAG